MASTVIRSMPGAPWLRLTASHATVAFSWLTICSIRFSYIAFFGDFRERVPCLPLRALEAAAPLGRPLAGPGWRPQLSLPAVSDDSQVLSQSIV
jgi:hypothetical protein